ncbi:hypothetical protein DB30_01163 [Enhygromyxa salina]|uniref:VWFA domain-containing protein n=1 Tax=Enhygromyxa salina TaxID=215803 RepID=A0A0C2CSR1_9BACT|nr:hypothetical protein DB30_01163 [Enhygromyxa salina]
MLSGSLSWGAVAAASNPIPSSTPIEERVHDVQLDASPEGATLIVTRSLFNPGPLPAEVELPIPLPCSASLDAVAVQAPDETGALIWRPAELLDTDEAWDRWQAWVEGPPADIEPALNADTAVHVSRSAWGCEASLSIYPIPPMHTRSVSYRVFVPSVYADGRHVIELPQMSPYGRHATVELDPPADPAFTLSVDGQLILPSGASLDGDLEHRLEFTARDRGSGHASAADLDLAQLVASTPAALAALDPGVSPTDLPHLLVSDFEAPSELARLPKVRRVVVVLDASRSIRARERTQLVSLGAAYLEQLAQTNASSQATAELLLFDRRVRRVYHDFVPAGWAGEDLPKLDIAVGNGSEIGAAIDVARGLLEQPTTADGVDWIIVLSDLYLRHDFPVDDARQAAAAATPRVHVVRVNPSDRVEFAPGAAMDPWTAVARGAGGMLWEIGASRLDPERAANELIAPTRIWSLALQLEFAGAEQREVALKPWLEAGAHQHYADFAHRGAPLERAVFVGEVWGQRRAWAAIPTDAAGRRVAAALATDDPDDLLSDADRTALAFHAQVISPYTSAWAVAGFDGPAAAPRSGLGTIGLGGYGGSFGCGHGHGLRTHGTPHRVSFDSMVQAALDRCGATTGRFGFETTDLEIVAVDSPDWCIAQELWDLDITATQSSGRKRVTVEHVDGVLTNLKAASPV